MARAVSVAKIKGLVADRFAISTGDIDSPCRDAGLVYARHVAMYLSRKHTIQSLPGIGRLFNRDHCSVAHAIKKIDRLKQADPDVLADLAEIEQALSSA